MEISLATKKMTGLPATRRLGDLLVCQHCGSGKLDRAEHSLVCHRCARVYPIKNGKVFFCHHEREWPSHDPSATDPRTWSDWRRANFEFLRERLSAVEDRAAVLDIGVGPRHFQSLLQRFENVGLDSEPYAAAQVVSDLRDSLPFRSATFDVVLASNVLEHVKDPEEVLAECHRVLKPGGLILVTVPFLLHVHQAPRDFYRYTHFMLRELLERAHFQNVAVESLGSSFYVHHTMRVYFYVQLFQQSRGIRRLLVKILFNFSKIIDLLEKYIARRLPSNERYTPGYGAVGTA